MIWTFGFRLPELRGAVAYLEVQGNYSPIVAGDYFPVTSTLKLQVGL